MGDPKSIKTYNIQAYKSAFFIHFAKNSKSNIALLSLIIFKDKSFLNVLVGLAKLNY